MSKSVVGPELYKKHKEEYWFVESVKEVLKVLKTSKHGLTHHEASLRKKEYGPNSIKDENKLNAFKLLLSKFNSILIYVLLVTSIVSLYLDQVVEFYAILAIIAFTVVLGFVQEYRAERSVEALANLTAKKVKVLRNGKKHDLLAEDLVPGDIIVLRTGLVVPADLRLIESNSLSVNESILTGESVPKGKHTNALSDSEAPVSERDNMVFSGTSIMNGSGLGVVTTTGFNTEIGKISKTLSSIKNQKTPLQKKVDSMSAKVSYAVILLSILAFILLISRGEEPSIALILVAALAVGGIPEGFPLALTMALSSGVRRMARSNAIIKDMASVETLGTTTVICTDKTGTLTQNKMMVVNFNIGENVSVDGKPYEPIASFKNKKGNLNKDELKKHNHFFYTATLCNNSDIYKKEGYWELAGEPTEGALLGLARSAGYDEIVLRENNKKIFEEPFDSSKKFMITVHENKNTKTAYLKGAVEKVLEKATHVRKNGSIKKIDEEEKERINKIIKDYSDQALRVLALATKEIKNVSKSELQKELLKGYIIEGLVGIKDPVREEVFDSIKQCKTAGVRVIMVTGDHKNTAKAIGEQLHLFTEQHNKIIEGRELDDLSDEELDQIISKVAIFARTTPDHKFRIVKSLQRLGEIVAMTGDGVNDAPALKKADIGVSMGKGGTDVAREASNIVLTDDAFSSIVEAVKEGRTIYSNIRRFTYYLLTINAAELSIVLFAILFNLVTPLTALMILFINVITSSFPALGLSIEPTNNKVMKFLPRSPKEKLLSKYILLKIFIVVPFLIIGTLALYLWELYLGGGDVNKARTLAFSTIIVFELFHAFNARSLHSSVFKYRILNNSYFYLSLLLSIILTMVSIYTPWGNALLGTVPLAGMEWLIIILVASTVLISSEIIKLMIKTEIEEQKKLQGKDLKFE